MKQIKDFLILAIILLCSVGCEDTPPIDLGSIVGTVTDGSIMEPLQGVSVSISPTGKTMTTGSDGKFEFSDIEDGQYTVSVSKENYNSDSKSINVQSGVATADFTLITGNGSIELSKSTLDFGKYDNTLVFDIENIGKSDMTYTVECSKYDWMSVSPKSGSIESSRIEPIAVTIDRTKIDEDKSVTLPISSNAGSAEVLVKVTRNIATAELYVTPTSLDFGETSTEKYFTVKNDGTADLTFEFLGVEDWFSATCSKYTLASGESTTVTVTIDRDKFSTAKIGTLTINSNGGSSNVSLIASIYIPSPTLTLYTSEVDFGESLTTQTFTVYNTGDAAMTFSINESLSWLSASYTGSVAAGSSAVVTLTLDRNSVYGQVSEAISITSDGGSASVTVKAYEPVSYGTVSCPHKDLSIEISDVYMLSNVLYLEYKITYTGTQTASYFGVGYSGSSANDNEGNIYGATDIRISIGGNSYTSNSSISDIQPNTVFKGGIKISNIDSVATVLTTVKLDTNYNNGSGSSYEDIVFNNVPIIR